MKRIPLQVSILALMTASMLAAQTRVVGKFGEAFVNGRRVVVEVLVVIPPGLDEDRVAAAALQNQGARPFQQQRFATTGLDWSSGGSIGSPSADQVYISANQPTNFDAAAAFSNSQGTWNNVSQSTFSFPAGGSQANGCPSLVRECPGKQTFDGVNHVGWLSLKGCCTLGVTWFGTSSQFGPEADMALNTNFTWVDEANDSGSDSDFDAQTVFLHENGHVLGLDHSEIQQAVMFANYQEGRRNLHEDDQRGITFLYPGVNQTGSISGTVTDSNNTPIAGASVSIETTPVFAVTDGSGNYSAGGVPAIGTYSATATADGFESATQAPVLVGDTVNFSLSTSNGGGEDPGPCVPKGPFGRNCK